MTGRGGAYIRLGDESIVAPDHILNGMNHLTPLSQSMMRKTLRFLLLEHDTGNGQERVLTTASLRLSD